MLKEIAVAAAVALGAAGVSAETITFDDIYAGNAYSAISNGYAGLNWDNAYVAYGPYNAGTGYVNGTVSGEYVMFNALADLASFYSDTPFDLTSAYVTKAWSDGYTRFVGYVGSVQTYLLDIFSTTTEPTFVEFNWAGVTRVTLSDLDRTDQSVIDNLVINGNSTVSAVPVPAAVWMLGTGLLGMAGVGRKKKAQKELAA